MKLKPDINVPDFLQAVQSCVGEVFFITSEGDHLNMKSTLSQFIFTAVIAGRLQNLDGRITVRNPQDESLLRRYCI
ncbi:MAG: hypothetical protein HDQ96_01010 [Lachnospiraceae bacterium]|nr:hypothetical protein [Lachnospiraceae bacterium]